MPKVIRTRYETRLAALTREVRAPAAADMTVAEPAEDGAGAAGASASKAKKARGRVRKSIMPSQPSSAGVPVVLASLHDNLQVRATVPGGVPGSGG